jgi:DNA polymerase bacteriophage-type
MSVWKIHIDFETRSACDLKKSGADVYARHPTTDPLCMAWALNDEPVELWKLHEPPPVDLFMLIKDKVAIYAHNCAFELAIWNNVCIKKLGWPPLPVEQTHCTMAMAYAMALPGSLEKAAAAAGIKHQKDMAGHRVMLQISQPRNSEDLANSFGIPIWYEKKDYPEKFEQLYSYCINDVEIERELSDRLLPLCPQERRVWLLDQKINQRGVEVDLKSAQVARKLVAFETNRLNEEIRRVTNNAVATCTAHAQLKDWIKSKGIKCDGVAKGDVVELLSSPVLPLDVRDALLLRQEAAKSSTAKLESMLNGTCEDGRSRGLFQYHGAGTGRWAGRRIQLHNLPRPKLNQNEIENVFDIFGRVS